MRKVNKILMSAVAILLCLVLITTSVVSGIFARFTIYKKSETSVSFQSFGVHVKMTVDESGVLAKRAQEIKTTKIGESIQVEIIGLTLYPGDDTEAFKKAIHFVFDKDAEGKPYKAGVDLDIKLRVDVSAYTKDNYKVPADKFSYIADRIKDGQTADYFVPIGFRLNLLQDTKTTYVDKNVHSPWRNVVHTDIERTFAQCIGRYTDMVYNLQNKSPYHAYKHFDAGQDIVFYFDNTPDQTDNTKDFQNVNVDYNKPFYDFCLGFMVPMTWSDRTWTKDSSKKYSAEEIDEISTWLLNSEENKDRNFSLNVTFFLEIVPT